MILDACLLSRFALYVHVACADPAMSDRLQIKASYSAWPNMRCHVCLCSLAAGFNDNSAFDNNSFYSNNNLGGNDIFGRSGNLFFNLPGQSGMLPPIC